MQRKPSLRVKFEGEYRKQRTRTDQEYVQGRVKPSIKDCQESEVLGPDRHQPNYRSLEVLLKPPRSQSPVGFLGPDKLAVLKSLDLPFWGL